jgi:hypothetical protein
MRRTSMLLNVLQPTRRIIFMNIGPHCVALRRASLAKVARFEPLVPLGAKGVALGVLDKIRGETLKPHRQW